MSGNPAIVTGGASGIGAEIARQLLGAGYEVVVFDRQKPKDAAAKLHGVEVDLLDNNAVAQAAADVAKRFAVTHVVHNAGTIRPASIEQTKIEDLQALTQLHLGAALTITQAVLPGMKERAFGRIVLMSSVAGQATMPNIAAYATAKGAIAAFTRALAVEYGASGIACMVKRVRSFWMKVRPLTISGSVSSLTSSDMRRWNAASVFGPPR